MKNYTLSFQNLKELKKQLSTTDISDCATPLIQLYSSEGKSNVLEIYHELKKWWIGATVIGTSADQTIQRGQITTAPSCVVISEFTGASICSSTATLEGNLEQTSDTFYQSLEITPNTKFILCFGDRMTPNHQAIFSAFNQTEAPIVGGSTNQTANGRWAFLNGHFYLNHLVAAAVTSTKLSVKPQRYSEWNPIGIHFEVTKVDGNVLCELDNTPVHEVYTKYLANGESIALEKLHGFPLMKGDQIEQDVYCPSQFVESGYLLDKPLYKGDKVRFCYDHPELTIQQVHDGSYQLALFQPEHIFVYNCTSRLGFIEGNGELTPLQQLANCTGFYCMGELFKDGQEQKILHHSMTFLALREADLVDNAPMPEPNLASTISPLFSLVRHSFDDLESMRSMMQNQINQQAELLLKSYRFDPLTGLPNRRELKKDMLALSNQAHVVALKISNLKDINEKYGYLIADKLIGVITKRLQSYIQVPDADYTSLYSIGPGQWVALVAGNVATSEVTYLFTTLAYKLEAVEFHEVGFDTAGNIATAMSMGILSKADFEQYSVDELLFKTIQARCNAEASNRITSNAKTLVDEEQKSKIRLDRIAIANEAINLNKVVPYAQPIYCADNLDVFSYECLVRLRRGTEVLSPGFFLPYIEDTRIYKKLSKKMIIHSFALMEQREGNFSINLSPQDIMDDKTLELLEKLICSLDKPERVGLEIVESQQINNFPRMMEMCNRFRALGAKIIVDDFGTGYSNLDEIIKLEPDIIKLDGSLIKSIDVDVKQRKVASQLIKLCKVFEAKTVAEFVHNQDVFNIAVDIGADYLQGFYLGEPKELEFIGPTEFQDIELL